MYAPLLRRLAAPALLISLMAAHPPAQADVPVYGWVERVRVQLGDHSARMKAKLDSGARSSSLHATDIEVFRRDGRRYVRFRTPLPDDPESALLERPVTRMVRIKRHTGPYDRRPVVRLPVCLGDGWHEVEVSLTDRSRFIYPLLLGRRALGGVALIDPDQTHLRPARCSAHKPD